jgi:PAS domain S-box-containing protein
MGKGGQDPIAGKAMRLAVGIGALYALVGVGWILMSDAAVRAVSDDPVWLVSAQRYKGLFYVLATAVGLVLLVRAGYRRLLLATALAGARERQALERQEARFRQLHQSLAEVLWLSTPDGRQLLYLSPAFETLYGRPTRDFERDVSLWLDAVHPDDRPRARASHEQLATSGESRCEYRICRPDGSVRWVSDRKRTIVDADGRMAMIGGIAEDITARIERDVALATTQAELERRVAERTASLERVNAELDAFARTAAHDMKSPLNAIGGFSHLLRLQHAQALGADGQRMVAHIEQSTRLMAALVNDLLALSRVSTAPLERSEVDLAALGRELFDALHHQDPGRQVVFDAPPSLVLACDAGLVRSLLGNLIGNAWKYTGRSALGRIGLSVQTGREATVVRVADNGTGFDAGDGKKLFKPFHRFHAEADFTGTGIGLVTCQRIVHRHGGEIWVESTPGAGTSVQFTLAPAPPGSEPPVADAASPAAAGARVSVAGTA